MIPQSRPKPKKNSSRVNWTISFVFHALLVALLVYFAARAGYLGKQLQKISVQMVKEKPPEKPKEPPKAPPPPKLETPKVAAAPPAAVPKAAEPPPPASAPPAVAPPPAEIPAFEFGGGKTVVSESDPVQLYKGYMEYVLRDRWNRPENLDDANWAVEVRLHVDRQGNLADPVWQKSSGNKIWDDSVREVLRQVTAIDRPPPTNFPSHVVIRFDTAEEAEPVMP